MRKIHSIILWRFILVFLFSIISFFHIWKLESLPKGLYLDESSVGYNAALISKTGADEHGKYLPIFFEAFWEYKNPLYIYTTSLLFKTLGISVFNLRFTSFLFFFIFLIGIYLLSSNLFKNKYVTTFALLSAGFLPWFFSLSRIGFEVVSQITIVIFSLIFIRKTFYSGHGILNPLAAGFLIGLSLYTYSTARLLTLLLLISVFIIYYSFIKKLLILLSAFIVTAIPYIYFAYSNPGALTIRFQLITYIYDKNLTLSDKMTTFLGNYFHYLNPDFLLISGDKLLRHHTGASGELYWIVLALALVFFIYSVKHKSLTDRFQGLLLLNFLFAPVAAALTVSDSSLRSVLFGLYILIFSFYGLSLLIENLTGLKKRIVLICIFSLLSIETSRYIYDYFSNYSSRSVMAFEGYGFIESLNLAFENHPEKIFIINTLDQTGIHYRFYTQIMTSKEKTPVVISKPFYYQNACFVFPLQDKRYFDASPFALKFATIDNYYYKIRCY